ncbi:ribosomal protein L14-domain-containing protein [Pelagophyceae sp. CCMP2097]|nr:ribosomal protein L14-domain-containing protein [Pelagophyceae sp. CCMP2097]
MVFTRFVEVGRVCLVNYGPEAGKLCTIIDIVDSNKALVDGPCPLTGVARQVIPFKRLALTDLKVDVGKNARQKSLVKAWDASKTLDAWAATTWAKKLSAKAKRASLTDFQRFQLMVARKQRAALVNAKLAELKASA